MHQNLTKTTSAVFIALLLHGKCNIKFLQETLIILSKLLSVHSHPQRLRSFWSAPGIATSLHKLKKSNLVRSRDSRCRPKGAQPLGTKMLQCSSDISEPKYTRNTRQLNTRIRVCWLKKEHFTVLNGQFESKTTRDKIFLTRCSERFRQLNISQATC